MNACNSIRYRVVTLNIRLVSIRCSWLLSWKENPFMFVNFSVCFGFQPCVFNESSMYFVSAYAHSNRRRKKNKWSTNTWLAADCDDDDNGELYVFVCFTAARSKKETFEGTHCARIGNSRRNWTQKTAWFYLLHTSVMFSNQKRNTEFMTGNFSSLFHIQNRLRKFTWTFWFMSGMN